ncbi:2-succinyl-5-enolpyruvyl-6-hydroxy-3-cyclohexene- 1-carboxylic-acid synthase [Lentibacillus halophilus]|uniref:2-succinyl-5-enolpyruvyl-6-hydroxy-3-cyclohexene-1-carboxylate synthase n=1 Tax=Lentibacillus halophilus TaxID=295065 RepID=A0ABP3IV43_9BACI
MNHTEQLTRYTANFIDQLVESGLTDAVISPGSRSTPMAMLMTEHPDLKQWVVIDERSAAFFALGMAKQTKRPVAVVCTSGTAAANYFPAVIEAYYSRVPLIVLTADRPHELRDVGAPQAIDQIQLYGDYPKWFHDMALPEASDDMLAYVRNKAFRAVRTAAEGNDGPVHLNVPFREPLVPDFSLNDLWGRRSGAPARGRTEGKRTLDNKQLEQIHQRLTSCKKGLIVCGPQTDPDLADAITGLARAWDTPILADPLSQLRAGSHFKDHIIESYDAFLRSETIRKQLEPDYIIRFGAMPVSKAYRFFVEEHDDIPQFVVENVGGYREPAGTQTEFIDADAIIVCNNLAKFNAGVGTDEAWLETWQQMNRLSKDQLLSEPETGELTEGGAVRQLMRVIPDESSLYVGNSMAVRDLDTFFMTASMSLEVLANRGANGIDGMVSSGMGAAASGAPVTLMLGDLSFFHDMNGLLAAKQYKLNITILVINNNGGGIFSFLPQVNHQSHFETLFGTPMDIDFGQAIAMYGGTYQQPTTLFELENALHSSYQQDGLSVIEVKTDRADNSRWHRDKWQAIENELLRDGR